MLVNWVISQAGRADQARCVRVDRTVEVLPVDRGQRVAVTEPATLVVDCQTPPSLPMTTWLVSSGSNAIAW